MFYEVPLLTIAFSVFCIFFIFARKVRKFPRQTEESLVYPEITRSDSDLRKYFGGTLSSPNSRAQRGGNIEIYSENTDAKNSDSNFQKLSNMSAHSIPSISNKKNSGSLTNNPVSNSFRLFFGVNILSVILGKIVNILKSTGSKEISKEKKIDIKPSAPEDIRPLPRVVANAAVSIPGMRAPAKAVKIKLETETPENAVIKESLALARERGMDDEGEKNIQNQDSERKDVSNFSLLKENNSEFDEQYWISVLAQDPKSSFTYKKLGEIYATRGDYKEARTVLKHALKLDPADDEVAGKLAELRGKRTKKT